MFRTKLALCIALISSVSLMAQVSDPEPADDGTGQQQASTDTSPSNRFFPHALRQVNKTLSYGVSLLQGDGFSRDDGHSSSEAFFAVLPYVSLDLHRDRFQLIVQSTPAISYVPSRVAGFGINGFLDPRAGFAVRLSPRVIWETSMGVSYGDQYIHVLALSMPSCGPACDDVSGKASESAQSLGTIGSSAQDLTSAAFSTYGQTNIDWQRTERQGISLVFGKSYSTSPDSTSSPTVYSDATFARVQVIESLTPLIGLGSYTQFHYLRSPGYACASTGTGLLFQQRISRSTAWSLQAGPEFGDSGCGQRAGLNIAGTFRRRVGQRSLLILTGGRDQSTYYVPGSRWVTSADATFHHQLSDSMFLEFNGGYLKGSSQADPLAAFSGVFISPSVVWKLRNDLTLDAGYGHLAISRGSGSTLGRDWLLAGLTWHAKPKQL